MPKLWDDTIEPLHILLRRARLAWAEKATDDTNHEIKKAIEEATIILMGLRTIEKTRESPQTRWDSPIGSRSP